MKNIFYIILLACLLIKPVFSQIGYGTNAPNPNSVLHLYSQDSTKGLLIPVASSVKLPVASTQLKGMTVYNVTESCVQYCNGLKWKCLDSLGPAIDSVNFYNDTLYVYENNKVLKTRINPGLDTNLINDLTFNKYDSLYHFVSDSLLTDDVFLDSLIDKIKNSIDTDIDSINVKNDTLYIYENGNEIKTLLTPPSSEGNFLVYGSDVFGGQAKVWDASTTSWYAVTFSDEIDSVIVSKNNFLVYASDAFGGEAKAWSFSTKSWSSISFSDPLISGVPNDGNFLVYGGDSFGGEAAVWDATTGNWYSSSFSDPMIGAVISNENFLVYAGDTFGGQAKVWNYITKSWVSTSFSDPVIIAIAD